MINVSYKISKLQRIELFKRDRLLLTRIVFNIKALVSIKNLMISIEESLG